MKQPTELLNEAIVERKAIVDKAFEAFCKHELLYLADIISDKKKDLESSEKQLASCSIEHLLEMFNRRDRGSGQIAIKDIWIDKVKDII